MATLADDVDVPVGLHAPLEHPNPVVGGEPVADGKWPDVVGLYSLGQQFACSGVLIAPDLVLTAGHCGYGMSRAVVGTADLAQGGESAQIVQNLVHEDYLNTIDAAVLRLDHPIPEVVPRVLARDCVIDDDLYAGSAVAIVGFGAIDEEATESTTVLHEADTTVNDPACADLSAGCNESVSPGSELTAGGDGVDSCLGDSGGPLYLLVGDQGPDADYVVGITSRASNPNDSVCGDGGIYVRSDVIADWVEASLGIELPRPVCSGNQPPEPTAAPIVAVKGRWTEVAVLPNDPDEHQSWDFAIEIAPAHGVATVSGDGVVRYDASDAPLGEDAVTVAVTDDGTPPRVGAIEIPIDVVPVAPGTQLDPGKGCGCGSTGAGGRAGLVGLLVVPLTLRRRPRPSGRPTPGR